MGASLPLQETMRQQAAIDGDEISTMSVMFFFLLAKGCKFFGGHCSNHSF